MNLNFKKIVLNRPYIEKRKDDDIIIKFYFISFKSSMMRDAYVSTEDRIKRNIKNIQRNTSEYEKNFARK